ncbi:hypothetical protein DY052_06265 [Apilactobacillus timberlakei]|uniref:hypothetical protein n=1 Tax=Apilactobacillus timberlakei TaxID=2008380 RepID=UPI001126CDCC|nr:hypothetical protein [Apilactobacillus timberlakei]TPR15028.1 hypothetical protein DY052_06265 [Apilactobacillus timberlakei]
MSTNSMIIAKGEDGFYRGIYSHWDGYIEHNGAILQNHYNDLEKVNKLISLGNISSLEEKLPDEITNDKKDDHITFTSLNSIVQEYKDDITTEYIYIFEDNKWLVMVNNGKTLGNIVQLDIALALSKANNREKLIELTGSTTVL